MTIDESIKELIAFKDKSWDGMPEEVIDVAIDTMRKYQKIQEIVKQKDYDRFNTHNYYGDFLRVQDIRKVLEDGND